MACRRRDAVITKRWEEEVRSRRQQNITGGEQPCNVYRKQTTGKLKRGVEEEEEDLQ